MECRAYRVEFVMVGSRHVSCCTIVGSSEPDAMRKCAQRLPGAQPLNATRCDRT